MRGRAAKKPLVAFLSNLTELMPHLLTDLDVGSLGADIRVAFFDIDGTLLDREGNYSDELRRQIKRIRALGVRTAIASGRPHFAARFLMDDLELIDAGVFCSGAQVYEPASGKTLSCAPMPSAACRRLLERLREIQVYYELYGLNDFYIETDYAAEVSATHARHLRLQPRRGPLDHIIDGEPVLKWVLGARKDEPLDVLRQIESEFPEFTFSYAAFPACPEWHFVNVIAREANKEQAFAWLLEHYQVKPEQVASFGDSHSDETFLSLAGYGVAMGNASDEVKAVAKFVTRNSWDDGVAYALARLI